MSLTALDAIVIVVVLISAILAMVRGFVREVLSVASWVIAAVAAYVFYDDLLPVIQPYLQSTTVATIVAAAAIFFVALVVASYITMKIADFVIDSRAGALDRLLGFVFGGLRGGLLLVIAFQFFLWLEPDPPAWIAQARSTPVLKSVGDQLIAALPQDIETTILEQFRGRSGDDETPNEAPADAPAEPGAGAQRGEAPRTPAEGEPGYNDEARQRLDQIFENQGN